MWYRLRSHIIGWFWTLILRLLAASWTKEYVGLQVLDDLLAERRTAVIAFWHGKYVPLLVLLRTRKVRVVTTASKRGGIIADMSRHFDYAVAQLPDHAPRRALWLLRQTLRAAPAIAVAVDGPLGPHHVVKHGIIQVVARLGCPVLPVSVAARRRWASAGRWDRMEIPLPFTRVCIAVGRMITIPADVSADELSYWAERLAAEIDAATRLAEQRVGKYIEVRRTEEEPMPIRRS